MKKSILIIRTSTDRQEVETQKAELIAYAKRNGCKNYEVIGGAGASAIKMDDEYRHNMAEVYKAIESGNVDCVYAWELSRIGRNEEVLMKFKNTLIDRGIQLKIMNPTLQLLNEDGTVNSGMELALSVFITLSKQEMSLKMERFRRGKARNKADGKFCGGTVHYGYRTDENKHFVVYEPEAEIVRFIFDEYLRDGGSVQVVERACRNRGYDLPRHKVLHVLTDELFTGLRGYPAIVSEEIWERCKAKRLDGRKLPRNRGIYVDYTHGLVRCTKDGIDSEAMVLMRAKFQYRTARGEFHCNINYLDWLTLEVLQIILSNEDDKSYRAELRAKRKMVVKEMERLDREMEEMDERLDKLQVAYYVKGKLKDGEKLIDLLNSDMQANTLSKLSLQRELEKIDSYKSEKVDLYTLTEEEKRDAVRKYVNYIMLWRGEKSRLSTLKVDFSFSNLSVNGASVYLDRRNRQWRWDFEPENWRPLKKTEKKRLN